MDYMGVQSRGAESSSSVVGYEAVSSYWRLAVAPPARRVWPFGVGWSCRDSPGTG